MRSFKGKIGLISIYVLVLLPVLMWLGMKPLDFRFEGLYMTFTSIGQISAIVGTMLFSLALLLSARLHFLEEYFWGLDRMYNIHHKIGTLAFIFLLVHPVMLAARYIESSFSDAAFFLLPAMDEWPKNLGIIALLSLMLILSVTFFTRWRYQILKFLHQILGYVFFIGFLHALLIPGELSSSTVLKWYIISIASISLIAYLYRTQFGSILVPRYTYTVSAVKTLDATVTEIVMTPNDTAMRYIPGQFIFISFLNGGIETEIHPFSISSAPFEHELRITVKGLGDYTKSIRNLQVGATAKIEGPFGAFSYLYAQHTKQIWIAGGIGITPFLNMARNLRVNQQSGHTVDFYYSTKTRSEMIFLDELQAIASEYSGLKIIPFCGDEQGFLTMDVVEKESGTLVEKDIYVCGPPPMMKSIIAQSKAKGVPASLIHAEEFKLL